MLPFAVSVTLFSPIPTAQFPQQQSVTIDLWMDEWANVVATAASEATEAAYNVDGAKL